MKISAKKTIFIGIIMASAIIISLILTWHTVGDDKLSHSVNTLLFNNSTVNTKQTLRPHSQNDKITLHHKDILQQHSENPETDHEPLADSPEELKWLIENGYPTQNDIDSMSELSTDQLGDLAKSGNRVAQVFLGTRLALVEKNFDLGLSTLENAAMNGSVYALTSIADIYASTGNHTIAQGYRIAAMLRGDYETIFAHEIINSFSSDPVPQWELSLGFLAGQAIIDRLNQLRLSSGLGYLPPAIPKPGAEEAFRSAMAKIENLSNGNTGPGQP